VAAGRRPNILDKAPGELPDIELITDVLAGKASVVLRT
jgi:hypothetical protein